jgi:hypothetical protein
MIKLDKDDLSNIIDTLTWTDVEIEYAVEMTTGRMLLLYDMDGYSVADQVKNYTEKRGMGVHRRYVTALTDWEEVEY